MFRRTTASFAQLLCTKGQRAHIKSCFAEGNVTLTPSSKSVSVDKVTVDNAAWRLIATGAVKGFPSNDKKRLAELDRLVALMGNTEEFRSKWGVEHIIGVDEAGRGCWAGCVSVAAVSIPMDVLIEGATDSKKLSEKARLGIFQEMLAHEEVKVAAVLGSVEEIDRRNILRATTDSMKRAVELLLESYPELKKKAGILVDGSSIVYGGKMCGLPADDVEKGDLNHLSVAAASIVAKTLKNLTLLPLETAHPEYSFSKHKSYGTALHKSELDKYGPIRGVHRQSFRPMKEMKNWRE